MPGPSRLTMLRIGVDYEQSNWSRLLPRIVFTINNQETRATGFSPFFVERGREPLLALDSDKAIVSQTPMREDTDEFLARMWDVESQVAEKIIKAKEFVRETGDKRTRDAAPYSPGDYVWLSTKGITMPWDRERKSKKFTARYYGPFKILRQTSPVTYELELPAASNIHPIMHVSLLKPWKAGSGIRPPPLPVPQKELEEYEVEEILGHRSTRGGNKKYLVKWKGYTFEECTWEPQENFKSHTLRDYHAKRKRDKDEESESEDEKESAMVMVGATRAKAFPRSCKNSTQPMEVDKTHTSTNSSMQTLATGPNAIPIADPIDCKLCNGGWTHKGDQPHDTEV